MCQSKAHRNPAMSCGLCTGLLIGDQGSSVDCKCRVVFLDKKLGFSLHQGVYYFIAIRLFTVGGIL